MKSSVLRVVGATLIASVSMSANAAIWYVKPGGAGLANGSSWANAMANPQTAIDAATATGQTAEAADIIVVAAGTYLPPGTSGDRTRTFMS